MFYRLVIIILCVSAFYMEACRQPPDCSPPVFKEKPPRHALAAGVSAKRAAPAPVAPAVIDNTLFLAPDSPMGYIEARNSKTGSLLWKKQVYTVQRDANLEQDVQDVFIDSLVASCNYLFIHNRKNEVYRLDPSTGQLIKL